jgi:hypothetical protein
MSSESISVCDWRHSRSALPFEDLAVGRLSREQLEPGLDRVLLGLVGAGLQGLLHQGVIDLDVGPHDVYQA